MRTQPGPFSYPPTYTTLGGKGRAPSPHLAPCDPCLYTITLSPGLRRRRSCLPSPAPATPMPHLLWAPCNPRAIPRAASRQTSLWFCETREKGGKSIRRWGWPRGGFPQGCSAEEMATLALTTGEGLEDHAEESASYKCGGEVLEVSERDVLKKSGVEG